MSVHRIAAAEESLDERALLSIWLTILAEGGQYALLRITVDCASCMAEVNAVAELKDEPNFLSSGPTAEGTVNVLYTNENGVQHCSGFGWHAGPLQEGHTAQSRLRQCGTVPILAQTGIDQLFEVTANVWFGRAGISLIELTRTSDGLTVARQSQDYPPDADAKDVPVTGGPVQELRFHSPVIARLGSSIVAIDNANPAPLRVLSRMRDVFGMLRHIHNLSKSFDLFGLREDGDEAFLDLTDNTSWAAERARLGEAKKFIEDTENSQLLRTGFTSGQGQACALSVVNRRALKRAIDAFVSAVESLMLVKDALQVRRIKRRRVSTLWNEKLHAILQVQRGDATAPSLLQCLRRLGPALQQLYMSRLFGGPASAPRRVAEQYYHDPEEGNVATSRDTLAKLREVKQTLAEERMPGAAPGQAAHAMCKRVAEVQRQKRTRAQTSGPTGAHALNHLMKPRSTTLSGAMDIDADASQVHGGVTGVALVRPPDLGAVACIVGIVPPNKSHDFWLGRVLEYTAGIVRIAYYEMVGSRVRSRRRSTIGGSVGGCRGGRRSRNGHDSIEFTPWEGAPNDVGLATIVDTCVQVSEEEDGCIRITTDVAAELTSKVMMVLAPNLPVLAEEERYVLIAQSEDGEQEEGEDDGTLDEILDVLGADEVVDESGEADEAAED